MSVCVTLYVCLPMCLSGWLAFMSGGVRLMLLLQGISLQVVGLKGRQRRSDELICFFGDGVISRPYSTDFRGSIV